MKKPKGSNHNTLGEAVYWARKHSREHGWRLLQGECATCTGLGLRIKFFLRDKYPGSVPNRAVEREIEKARKKDRR